MSLPLKARVSGGQIILEDPKTELPEGTVLELYPAEDDDDLDDDERAKLDAFLEQSLQSAERGKVSHEEVMRRMKEAR